jgi:hypothetical protein
MFSPVRFIARRLEREKPTKPLAQREQKDKKFPYEGVAILGGVDTLARTVHMLIWAKGSPGMSTDLLEVPYGSFSVPDVETFVEETLKSGEVQGQLTSQGKEEGWKIFFQGQLVAAGQFG